MVKTQGIYSHPIQPFDPKVLRKDSPAHTGNLTHALDYIVQEGTAIYAVADGEVVHIKDDSTIGGDDKKYWFDGNRVVVKHAHQEYSAYEHLRHKGVVVRKGEKVKVGTLIGYSGNTGYSKGPHLHFEVFKFKKRNPDPEKDEIVCLEVQFKMK